MAMQLGHGTSRISAACCFQNPLSKPCSKAIVIWNAAPVSGEAPLPGYRLSLLTASASAASESNSGSQFSSTT